MSDSLIFFYLIKREYIGLFTIKCKEMLINFMLCPNLKVCTRSVRSALEYAVLSWQSIPGCLSDKIESTQKSALMIIFPCADSYLDALELARVETLTCRRDKICKEYICKMKDLKPPSSSSSTNTPRRYLSLHPKAQIRPAVLLQKRYYL